MTISPLLKMSFEELVQHFTNLHPDMKHEAICEIASSIIEAEAFEAKVQSAAKHNPELPIDFIREILLADAEEASFEYVFD